MDGIDVFTLVKCYREEGLILTPIMLSKVLAALPFLLTLGIKPSLVESSVSSYSVFKQDVPECSWRCETPTRICRGPNYSPVAVLASRGSHSQHCSPPGSFWSSISLA